MSLCLNPIPNIALGLTEMFSGSQVVTKKSSNHNFFLFKVRIEVKDNVALVITSSFWTKNLSFNDLLMTTWEEANECQRKKEPENPGLANVKIQNQDSR